MIYMQEEAQHAPYIAALHDKVFPVPANGASAALRRASQITPELNIIGVDNRAGQLAGSIRGYVVNAGGVKAALVSPLAVDPAYQKNKFPDVWDDQNVDLSLGRSLMNRFCSAAQRAGCEIVVLKCSTEDSMDFYKRNGFFPMGWSKVEWPSAKEAPVAMVRPLSPGVFNRAAGLVTPVHAHGLSVVSSQMGFQKPQQRAPVQLQMAASA